MNESMKEEFKLQLRIRMIVIVKMLVLKLSGSSISEVYNIYVFGEGLRKYLR